LGGGGGGGREREGRHRERAQRNSSPSRGAQSRASTPSHIRASPPTAWATASARWVMDRGGAKECVGRGGRGPSEEKADGGKKRSPAVSAPLSTAPETPVPSHIRACGLTGAGGRTTAGTQGSGSIEKREGRGERALGKRWPARFFLQAERVKARTGPWPSPGCAARISWWWRPPVWGRGARTRRLRAVLCLCGE